MCHARAGGIASVLFLHGYGNDALVWDDVVARLGPNFSAYCLDLRGHGESAHAPNSDYSLEAFMHDLEDFIGAAEITRCILVGHSLGGTVAANYAASHPQGVRGLVLVDTGPSTDRTAMQAVNERFARMHCTFEDIEAYERLIEELYPLASFATVQALAHRSVIRMKDGRCRMKIDPAVAPAIANFETSNSRTRLWQVLGGIQCRTLLVRGQASALLNQTTAEEMAYQALRRGSLAVVKAAGHSVMIDNPEDFKDAVLPFIRQSAALE